jgi:hypothetical protein
MISTSHPSVDALSAGMNGMKYAIARFDRAAQSVVWATEGDAPKTADGAQDIPSAMSEMITSRLAFVASLQLVRLSHEMLRDAIGLAGYDTTAPKS